MNEEKSENLDLSVVKRWESESIDRNMPLVFIAYSHASFEHKKWVENLCARLRRDCVYAAMDKHIPLGSDLTLFMEQIVGSKVLKHILCVCSSDYTAKAQEGRGGVGYEKMIMTIDVMKRIDGHKIIPIIRDNENAEMPAFLGTRLYCDFRNDVDFEDVYKELLTDILGLPKAPPLGNNSVGIVNDKSRVEKVEKKTCEITTSSSAVDYYLYFQEEEDYCGEYDTYFGFRKCVWPQPKLPLAQMREFLRFEEFEHTFESPEWGGLETLTLRVGVMEVEEFRSKFSKEMRQKNYGQGRHIFQRAHNMLKSEFIDKINGNDNYDCPF